MARPAEAPLARRIVAKPDEDTLLSAFLDYCAELRIDLYPAQEEAVLELFAGKNIILATPTGSGKSLVAIALHFKSICEGRRSFYTAPIKALVSEKFFSLCEAFGAENVGLMTGDASVNRDAPIICCTAEVLSNLALGEGANADVGEVIADEFHYYSDPERGVAWQIPLLTLPEARFLLMSATLGPTERFEEALTTLTGVETRTIRSMERPVPLAFDYRETPLHETIDFLRTHGRTPLYLVSFTQREAAERAQDLMSVDVCTKEEKRAIQEAMIGVRFQSPFGKEIQRYLKHGIGLHHAGLLPRYRLLVERLAQQGLLKVISGTDTLGVGINVPIRTVLFTKLCKYDGQKTGILSVRDFQQIAGRAGRKGFDTEGWVVAQAPEHIIENLRNEAKASADPSKRKKLVKAKPPEKGYTHWDRTTFERLRDSSPEPLESRFKMTHGMLLTVLSRPDDGCGAIKSLIKSAHESPAKRREHGRYTRRLLRSLYSAKVVKLIARESNPALRDLVVDNELQLDFSLHHALSLFVAETIDKLDPSSPTYAVDVLTLVEATLENPDAILMRQTDSLKKQKLSDLKAAGVEYEERMAELEKIEHPQPLRDFLYEALNEFRGEHPWLDGSLRPKSIARDMMERYATFAEYIKEYDLQRSEGVVLRYLSHAYKALKESVPDRAKTDDVRDIEDYLGATVRGIDASLLEEWQRLMNPEEATRTHLAVDAVQVEVERDVTADRAAFLVLVRAEIFRLLRLFAARRWQDASELLADPRWSARSLEQAVAPYFAENADLRTDNAARAKGYFSVRDDSGSLFVQQTLVTTERDDEDKDEAAGTEWSVVVNVDLPKSREAGIPVWSSFEVLAAGSQSVPVDSIK